MSEKKDSMQRPSWYEAGFQVLESTLNGEKTSSLHGMRTQAHRDLLSQGLPKAKNEDWKYTDIREVREREFSFASKNVTAQVEDAILTKHALKDLSPLRIDTVDGFVSTPIETIREQLPAGVKVTSLREIFSHRGGELEVLTDKYFGKIAPSEDDAVAALNTSFTQDGLVFLVEKGVEVCDPIYIQHLASGLTESTALFPRVLCIVQPEAKVAIVEHFTSVTSDTDGFTASMTEISVGDNAECSHYLIGEDSDSQIRFSRVAGTQGRDSRLKTFSCALGGKLVRQEVHPTLNGENGFTGMYGLSVLNGSQHVDNHTVLDHAVPHCESDERYKGIYDGDSKGVFCGTIIVRPDAQKTNAIQNNQAVLLSDKASVNTKPQLKIWADDVKCTHGATVGQLDTDQLFYLRSRGISQKDARNLLLRAFAGDVTQEICFEKLRSYVEDRVVAKLSL